jgi:hypothetical protein
MCDTDIETQGVFLSLHPKHNTEKRYGMLASDAGHGVDLAHEADAPVSVALGGIPARM